MDESVDYPRLPDGSLDVEEMARVVANRRKRDPAFDAQCRQDINDFFRPSPLFEQLRKKEK